MNRPVTLTQGQKYGLDGHQYRMEWSLELDDEQPGMARWEDQQHMRWHGTATAARLMAASINSFLNNMWVTPNPELPPVERTMANGTHIWTCGQIPYSPEYWEAR